MSTYSKNCALHNGILFFWDFPYWLSGIRAYEEAISLVMVTEKNTGVGDEKHETNEKNEQRKDRVWQGATMASSDSRTFSIAVLPSGLEPTISCPSVVEIPYFSSTPALHSRTGRLLLNE